MGEMRRRGMAGIVQDVAFFPRAKSVGGREGVTVWVDAFRGGVRETWHVETGQGWRWTFPW